MKSSALQLKHYHFVKLLLEVNEQFDYSAGPATEMYAIPDAEKMHAKIKVNQPESLQEGAEPFNAIELQFSYEEEGFPYHFDVELFGVVSCAEPLNNEEEKHEHMFVVNSVSILYSAIRDQLLTLSARYQYGPMMLPSLDFRSLTKVEG